MAVGRPFMQSQRCEMIRLRSARGNHDEKVIELGGHAMPPNRECHEEL
jgi:hypothetical protein